MSKKTYTWSEAWNLMVNHGRKMFCSQLQSIDTWCIFFDKKSCLFKFATGEPFFISEKNCNELWTEYEYKKYFIWRDEYIPSDIEIIIETNKKKHLCGILREKEGIFYDSIDNGKYYLSSLGIKRWSYIPE